MPTSHKSYVQHVFFNNTCFWLALFKGMVAEKPKKWCSHANSHCCHTILDETVSQTQRAWSNQLETISETVSPKTWELDQINWSNQFHKPWNRFIKSISSLGWLMGKSTNWTPLFYQSGGAFPGSSFRHHFRHHFGASSPPISQHNKDQLGSPRPFPIITYRIQP